MNKYDDIPIGKRHAISREQLQELWGLSERGVRKVIAELRQEDNGDDYVLVSTSSGKGYYRTRNIDEIELYKKETMNRARHTFAPLKKVNRILSEHEADNQMEFTPVNNLRAARKEAGLTARAVVEVIRRDAVPKFNAYDMSRIENNRCYPTSSQLLIMSRLYRKSPSELTGMEMAQI
ncbi:MAG: hypothetical protein ACI4LK_06545 [Lentihominibacter sp.]